MMSSYVAFLYSIGIRGGRLIMSDWRALMKRIGLQNPRTLIATGNAVFESRGATIRELEIRLEDAFERSFGRRVDTIVRTSASFRRLAASNPFREESERDGSRVLVRLMRRLPSNESIRALETYMTQGERLRFVNGDLWIYFAHEPNHSKLLPILASKRLGIGTVRNWNTIRRLDEMLDS